MKFSVFKNSNTETEYLAYCKGEVADLWFEIHASKEQVVVSSFRETNMITYFSTDVHTIKSQVL